MTRAGHAQAEKGKQGFLDGIMAAHPAMFGRVTQKATLYRFQVLLSEVVEGEQGSPARLVRHGYRLDQEYFWPASSAIKLCGAVAAVQRVSYLKELLGVDITYTTPLTLFPLFEDGVVENVDSSNLDQQNITIAHEIRKLFLVSDNIAFNRLYNFVGLNAMNRAMWSLGLLSARLQHRLDVFWTLEEDRFCSPVGLKLQDRTLTLPPKKSSLVVPDNSALPGVRVGSAYVTEDGQLVSEPMDFSQNNYMSLLDLQNLLVKLVRTDIELGSPPLRLGEGARMMLIEAMSQYPGDSSNPKYKRSEYADDYCKFFLPGLSRVRSKGALRIYNKAGRAYGFTVENSYIFDIETGRSFFLSAVLYTNRNGILNDDKYEYTDVADRLMADLGEVAARAVWQIPPCVQSLSSPFDCIPSSMWTVCSCPLVQESPPAVHDYFFMDGAEAYAEDEHSCIEAAGCSGAETKMNGAGVSDILPVSKAVGCSIADPAVCTQIKRYLSPIDTTLDCHLPVPESTVPSCTDSTLARSALEPPAPGPSSIRVPASSLSDLPLSFHAFSSPEVLTPADRILSRLSRMNSRDSWENSLVEPSPAASGAYLPALVLSAQADVDTWLEPSLPPTSVSPGEMDAASAGQRRWIKAGYRHFLDA